MKIRIKWGNTEEVKQVFRKCSSYRGSNYINYTNVMSSFKCHPLDQHKLSYKNCDQD